MRRFKGFKYLSLVLGLMIMLSLTIMSVPLIAADITQPEEFYGNISINGNAAPSGITIIAKINNVERGNFTTNEIGVYGGPGTFDVRLVVSGQADDIGGIITFWVNGKAAGQTSEFVSGAAIELDLNFQSFPLEVTDSQIIDALNYLRQAQAANGSIGSYVASSWVVMAIVAAGQSPSDWKVVANSVVSYLEDNAAANLDFNKATDLERSILAIVAAGESPYAFGNYDYVAGLTALYDGSQMGDDELLNDDSWGILALKSAGAGSTMIPKMALYLKNHQNADGGWGWGMGVDSDVDNTAATISALLAAGEETDSSVITAAVSFLKSKQQNNGGFTSQGTTNAATDAWAIRAICDLGQSPLDARWQQNGNDPLSHLLSLQDTDGSFKWTVTQKTNSVWMTAYALTALLQATWPADTVLPIISGISPASGSSVSGTDHTLSANYTDSIVGIDTVSARMWLDNNAVSATATAASISYSASGLASGNHTVKVAVADKAGNAAEKVWTFSVTTPSSGGGGAGGSPIAPPTPAPTPKPTPSATPVLVLPPGTIVVDDVVDDSGRFTQALVIQSQDIQCNLQIETGVVALTQDRQPINQISITGMTNAPAAPSEARIIGLVYNFGPEGATFKPPLTLTYNYDPASLLAGVSEDSLTIATWDPVTQQWIELESIVDRVNHTIQAKVRHFSAYGIVAHTSPASFTPGNLTISPTNAEFNQMIDIEAIVTNTGDIRGNYQVALIVDDVILKTQSFSVVGHGQSNIKFELKADKEGLHTVNLGDLTGTYFVKAMKPAEALVIQSLVLEQSEYVSGENIIITAFVRNSSSQPGTFILSLKVNDQVADSKVISLAGGVEQRVDFAITESAPGDYLASLNNISVPFKVGEAPAATETEPMAKNPTFNWLPVLAIASGAIIIILILALVLSRRRAK